MSFTDRTNGRAGSDGVPRTVASIPLTDIDARRPGEASIGTLVKDATAQVSTLVRAEVELAKAELTGEIKKGVKGSVYFILALTVLLFSSFFFFFFLAELLDLWLWRWSAFLIVFLVQLVTTGLLAFLGYLKVRKIRKPEKTLDSMRGLSSVLPKGLDSHPANVHTAALSDHAGGGAARHRG